MATESLHISLHRETHSEKQFISLLRKYFAFHFVFILFLVGQAIAFIHLLSASASPTLLAYLLAGLVLSTFTYFILHFYFQTRKGERIHLICDQFIEQYKTSCRNEEANLFLANAVYRFWPHRSKKKSFSILLAPLPLASVKRAMKKTSFFITWKDLISITRAALTHLSTTTYRFN
jgi:hypothetical protein